MGQRHRAVEMLVNRGSDSWAGRRVFVTGHTGFKGSWLALWLADLGAEVTGFALPPPTDPSLFEAARVAERVTHVEGDVRDLAALSAAVAGAAPEVIFHLAAQPIVRLSYEQPVETYATNVMGTVHLLEAARRTPGVRAVVSVTSDKCYENREWVWPYREVDPMGGHDPYSSSKGCAELVTQAYRRSYFGGANAPLVASVRAGNVIGGGDWAADRLVPDLVRALEADVPPAIRSPGAVRPWQHVLEALGGYLRIAERLLAGEADVAEAWNFGPGEADTRPVAWIVERMARAWGKPAAWAPMAGDHPHEAGLLRLDCSKVRERLGWRPTLDLEAAIVAIAEWHQAFNRGEDAQELTVRQIRSYSERRLPIAEPVAA